MGAMVARVPYCMIFTHDAERDALVCQGSNLPEGLTLTKDGGQFSAPRDPESNLYSAWTNGGVASTDGQGNDNGRPFEWLKGLEGLDGYRAIAAPLTNRGERIGVVCFVATADGPDFSQETMQAVETFSQMAGGILAGTQLYSQAERRSQRVVGELQQSIEMAGRFRESTQRKSMRFGPLMFEPSRESVRWQDNSLRLSKTEFDLLYVLAEKSGNVVDQETLTREVWGQDYVPQGKVVDVTIHRLRRKLAAFPQGRKLVQTVRGQGYAFVPPERFIGPQ